MTSPTPPSAPPKGSRHFVQLDGLRAFAVLAVILAHVMLVSTTALAGAVPWGREGVGLFFALSGFLITGILLRCREDSGRTTQNPMFSVRQFYVRRFLRIFPLYYATLAMIAVSNFEGGRHIILWQLTYTTNILIAVHHAWIGVFSHFWTLAVEEQFYLVWPWLILFLPRRILVPSILCVICVGIGFRLLAFVTGIHPVTAEVLPFGWLDVLGLGALLAICHENPVRYATMRRTLRGLALWGGLPIVIAVSVLRIFATKTFPDRVIFEAAMAMVSVLLIDQATLGFQGIPGRVLSWGPLCYLGKISYGVYMFHNFVIPVLRYGARHMDWQPSGPMRLLLVTGCSVALASISWHLFEKPINDLKDNFAYRPRKEIQVQSSLPIADFSEDDLSPAPE